MQSAETNLLDTVCVLGMHLDLSAMSCQNEVPDTYTIMFTFPCRLTQFQICLRLRTTSRLNPLLRSNELCFQVNNLLHNRSVPHPPLTVLKILQHQGYR